MSQLGLQDEWIIETDGHRPLVEKWVEEYGDNRVECNAYFAQSSYGNEQRNRAMRRARADYLVFVDDDDVLLPGALEGIRKEADALDEPCPMMFKMDYRPRRCILWPDKEVKVNYVAGSMLVLPNFRHKLPKWGVDGGPSGDLLFIEQAFELWGGKLKWCEYCIQRCDVHGTSEEDAVVLGLNARVHELANVYNSYIGNDTKVAALAEIGGAVIGCECKIQVFACIPLGVILGDRVFVGPHVCFTNDRHPRATGDWSLERTWVEDGASIGANATILSGVTIGEEAMVAAGAIVTRDVEPGETYICKVEQ